MTAYLHTISFLLLSLALLVPDTAHALEKIQVGVFQNKPIVYHDGKAKGLFVEVLDYVAEKEGWELEYITCKINTCLELLRNDDIQLMTSVGKNEERLQQFFFSQEPIWTFWGTIYANNTEINSIIDLEHKTIGVRTGNKITTGLTTLLNSFNISSHYKKFDNYDAAFEKLQNNEVDAVAVNNTYAFASSKEHGKFHKTPIVFNPFSAYFAASKKAESRHLLDTIDIYAKQLRTDHQSVYHTYIKQWNGITEGNQIALRKILLVAGPIAFFFIFFMALWHYRSVILVNRKLKKSITERIKAEVETQKQKEILQQALEIGKIGSWELSGKENGDRELLWAEENYKIFGLKSGTKVTCKTFIDCVHPEDSTFLKQRLSEIIRKQQSTLLLEHRILINGKIKWIREKAELSYNKNGKVLKCAGFAQDITEEKNVESEKKSLAKRLNQAQRLESIGRLAGGVAHDLNNLLTPILGYSELLLNDQEVNDTNKKKIKQVIKAGDGASALVRQLLAFSRKQTLEYKTSDVDNILAEFETLLRRTIRENIAIKIIKHPTVTPNLILADTGQIEQVIMNLAINAADAMPEGGVLTIETSRVELDEKYVETKPDLTPGEYIMIAFSDTGHGMDEQTCSQIFEPFFSTKGDMGTGLGLATVYGVVKQHSGHIWVYSEINKGTAIKVYLPVSTASAADEADLKPKRVNLNGLETILLVEDNRQVLDTILEMLNQYSYKVIVAETGKEALELAQANQANIDLLLTDVVIPDINVKKLYQQISAIYPTIKVIYMSGYTDDMIANQGVLEEGLHFIQKPFTNDDLIPKIRSVLNNSH